MLETLSDLTLRLSEEISALEADCTRDLAEVERRRDVALESLGAASSILARFQRGLERAKQTELEEIQAADDVRTREVLAAEDRRRRDLERDERRHRETRGRALAKRDDAVKKARLRWRESIDRARDLSLSEQRAKRRAADDALEKALEEARDGYRTAIEQARLEHQASLQDRLVEERLAVDAANRKAERLITGAAIAYERAVAQEEARMRGELAAYPEAMKIQDSHDRQMFEIRNACERAKESLFHQFRRNRRRGTVGR